MKKHALVGFAALLAITLPSCSNPAGDSGEGLRLYASFYPVYDFVKRIAKNHATVTNITPAGSEPHDYELTTSDLAGMEKADAIFVNGLNLEPWLPSLTASLNSKTYVISQDIVTRYVEGAVDPHVWLNPVNAIAEMKNIRDALISIDPTNEKDYQTNFEDASMTFEALDAYLLAFSHSFSNKTIVVSHAAFGYLCDRYGLDQIFVNGLSPEDEPSAADLSRIIEAVKTYHVSTIFYEELVSPEISLKIAQETGAKTETLNPLEGLSTEELSYEDYLSVMIDNFRKLEVACNDN